ncbi:chorismate--pyruvate lyase family protein [Nocardia sp. NPDC052316]|uniref:chorismate--pyruvate lyase family protein n=1 Tax=Nocardia sp. NPDC052316 TaxID=3364329 RepID=UPI0037CC0AE2
MSIRTRRPSADTISVTEFADPSTRTLLAGDGTTTLLLEAILRAPVTVRVREQHLQDAEELPPEIGRALQLPPQCRVLVRESMLITPDEQPVSYNRAIITTEPGNPLYPLIDDRHTPLGRALLAAAIEQHRQILTTGHRHWPFSAEFRAAAAKTYLIHMDGRPRLHLTETYSPDLFPADLEPAVCTSAGAIGAASNHTQEDNL